MKAIRGAISVGENSADAIREATQCLLKEIATRNALAPDEVVSMFFSLTEDLNAAFPARAAREIGWDVPMLDMQQVAVPGSLPYCLRVLIHVERNTPVKHAYLREAAALRADLEGQV